MENTIPEMHSDEWNELVKQGVILVNNGPNETGETQTFYVEVGNKSAEETEKILAGIMQVFRKNTKIRPY